jgi:prolyl-tRNA synthetase
VTRRLPGGPTGGHIKHLEAALGPSEVSEAYRRIFRRLGVPVVEVEGDGASMGGGSLSHEFHFPAPVGQDTLLLCDGG